VPYGQHGLAWWDRLSARHNGVMPAKKVDHYSQTPLAVQLAGILREQIKAGKLGHHDQIPSESQLIRSMRFRGDPRDERLRC